ncbi:hypothetical protein ACFC1W_10625 [Microbacterium sp. NPDC056003]|jgi:hypothetical protein|uniref:hypothetical protein n=1 Tax=Microbacterium sp. NPDC056003 TaxID=3345676 RepID=UPI0035DB878B
MSRPGRIFAASAVMTAAVALTSCAPWTVGEAVACPSWVDFETPADAAEESDAVFIGTIVGEDGTSHHMEVEMSAWSVDVDEVLTGDSVSPGERVRVVSMADPCSGEAVYEGGDPLDATGEQRLIFVYTSEDELLTLTPYQGVLPAPTDGEIPPEWPEP